MQNGRHDMDIIDEISYFISTDMQLKLSIEFHMIIDGCRYYMIYHVFWFNWMQFSGILWNTKMYDDIHMLWYTKIWCDMLPGMGHYGT